MPDAWKTVRVFISSTFRDMHAERDHLVKFVFPELRERCAGKRLHLVDVDLRWGVTEDEAERGRVLELCLDEIDRCRPFFVGILGERYGWPPPRYDIPDEPRYDWIHGLELGRSITAIEIDHGVFRNPAQAGRAFFYFRDPGMLESLPPEVRPDFEAEDPRSAALLADLKAAIRRNCPNVRDYRCAFGQIASGGRVVLSGLEAFGSMVLEDLWGAIMAANPEAAASPRNPMADDRAAHDAFIEERTRRFVGRRDLVDRVARFAREEGPGTLLVTGPPGHGKSALLAASVRRILRQDPAPALIYHFVGAGPGSTDIRRILSRLCRELSAIEGTVAEIPEGPEDLKRSFREALGRVARDRPVVLVVDALNQLDPSHTARSLDWLPVSPVPGLRLILSSLAGDCLDAAARLEPESETIEVGPLSSDDCRTIVRETLGEYRKRLDERQENDQLGALLGKAGASSPLYLLAACEELRVFGDYEGLGRRISDLPEDLGGLFGQVLERLERDHGRGLVEDSLSLLACARNGLLEAELLELLRDGRGALPKAVWSRLYRSLRFYLRPAGGSADSAVAFFHGEFASAVIGRFLGGSEERARRHRRLAVFFRDEGRDSSSGEWLAGRPRPLGELPFHLSEAGLGDDLYALASDGTFLAAQAQAFPDDPGLPLDTIRRALAAAVAADDPLRMAEFTMAHAERVAASHRETPPQALRQGGLQRALSLAALNEPVRSALWRLALAFELESLGRADEAAQVLRDFGRTPLLWAGGWEAAAANVLLLSLRDVPDDLLVSRLDELVGDTVEVRFRRALRDGRIEDALRLDLAVDKEWIWDGLINEALKWWRRLPPDRRAVEVLSRILDAVRSESFMPFDDESKEIAACLIERREYATAERLARLGTLEGRREVYLSLLRARAGAGDFGGAVEDALAIDDLISRVKALSEMSRDFPRVADMALAAAERVLGQAEGPVRTHAEAELVLGLDRAGRRSEALRLLDRARQAAGDGAYASFRSQALVSLVGAAVRLGNPGRTERLLAELRLAADEQAPVSRIRTLAAAGRLMALSGSDEAAEGLFLELAGLARARGDDSEKAEAFKAIAGELGQTGDADLVRRILWALKPADPIPPADVDDKRRALWAKLEASRYQRLTGDFEQNALNALASSLFKRGDFAAARETASLLESSRRLEILARLIETGIAGTGSAELESDLSSYLVMAKANKGNDRDFFLAKIVRILIGAGALSEALAAARSISRSTGLLEERASVALNLAAAGDAEGALEIAGGILDDDRRIYALMNVLKIIAASDRRDIAGRAVIGVLTTTTPPEGRANAAAEAMSILGRGMRPVNAALAGRALGLAVERAGRISDPASKVRIVLEIARFHLESGDLDDAFETGLCLKNNDASGEVFRAIADGLVGRGDLSRASAAVKRIPMTYYRNPALLQLVRAYLGRGLIREARHAVSSLALDRDPSDAVRAVMEAELEAGDEAAARTSANRLIKGDHWAELWEVFFGSRFIPDRFEWAMSTVARRKDRGARVQALGGLGAALSKLGAEPAASLAFDEALKEAAAVGGEDEIPELIPNQAERLASLAASLSISGRAREADSLASRALELLDRSRQGWVRDMHAATIARLWSGAGRVSSALAAVSKVKDAGTRGRLVGDIISARAAAGDLETALSLAEQHRDLEVLDKIARDLVGKGDLVGTRRILGRLWSIADAPHSGSFGESALIPAIKLSAKVGDVRKALEGLPMIGGDHYRSQTAWAVVETCLERGDIRSALEAHAVIEPETDDSLGAARSIGEAIARQGDFGSAVAVAEGRMLGTLKPGQVRGIAAVLAEKGQRDSARSLFKECSGRAVRTTFEDLLADIAEDQAKAGFGSDAVDTVRAILRERDQHLPRVLQRLVERNDSGAFKEMLELCVSEVRTAYAACAYLARLYPSAAGRILERLESASDGDSAAGDIGRPDLAKPGP